MTMVWSLVKKDFLLAKKFMLLMLGIGIAIPLYMSTQAMVSGQLGVFLFMAMYMILILSQYIGSVEAKYVKTEALLFASPYDRKSFVLAKYAYFLITFCACTLIYFVMGLISVIHIAFDWHNVLVTLVIVSLSYGIVLPMQFKFGVDKMRILFMFLLLSVTYGVEVMMPILARIDPGALARIPEWALALGALVISAALLGISALVSIRIYEQKEF